MVGKRKTYTEDEMLQKPLHRCRIKYSHSQHILRNLFSEEWKFRSKSNELDENFYLITSHKKNNNTRSK